MLIVSQVKRVAREKYNYHFGNESVSTFVTAFYDAVLLYGLALNETLAKGGNQSDGAAIVRAMWNKTFLGITGDVNIDSNGDRIADYSLLDMDPATNEFKVSDFITASSGGRGRHVDRVVFAAVSVFRSGDYIHYS